MKHMKAEEQCLTQSNIHKGHQSTKHSFEFANSFTPAAGAVASPLVSKGKRPFQWMVAGLLNLAPQSKRQRVGGSQGNSPMAAQNDAGAGIPQGDVSAWLRMHMRNLKRDNPKQVQAAHVHKLQTPNSRATLCPTHPTQPLEAAGYP